VPDASSKPDDCGLLDVGDGNRMYWETRGSPVGEPVLIVHGGPGAGRSRNAHKQFDPERFRIVAFDQRGCGDSVPSAADPSTDMSCNTTAHLLADMEALRRHLGIDRWLLYGGSWASTLILAYAQRHPDRVLGIVLIGVTMTRPQEVDWLYRGLRRFRPAEWQRFRDGVPEGDRDGSLVEAYRRLMEHPDAAVRERAAQDWCAWEDAAIAHEALGEAGSVLGEDRCRPTGLRSDLHALLRRRGMVGGRPTAAGRAPIGRHPRRADPRSPRPLRARPDGVGTRSGMAGRRAPDHRGLGPHGQPGDGGGDCRGCRTVHSTAEIARPFHVKHRPNR